MTQSSEAATADTIDRFTSPLPGHSGHGPTELRLPKQGRPEQVQTSTRVLLVVFTVFTLLAAISLLALGEHTDQFFAWTINVRPNSAFLGAAYIAGFVMSLLALRQQAWDRVRVSVVTVTAFTLLTLFPTLQHAHRLHLAADDGSARLAAWVWLAVYLVIPIACLAVVVRQTRGRVTAGEHHPMPTPMPRWLMAVLGLQAVVLTAAGAVLLTGGAATHMTMEVHHPGWPWPVTPLTSEAIGGWLLAFGFAIALAIRERDLSRMLVPAVAYATFGGLQLVVLLACRTAPGTNARWWWLDLAVLASLIPTGAYGAWAARAAATAQATTIGAEREELLG